MKNFFSWGGFIAFCLGCWVIYSALCGVMGEEKAKQVVKNIPLWILTAVFAIGVLLLIGFILSRLGFSGGGDLDDAVNARFGR